MVVLVVVFLQWWRCFWWSGDVGVVVLLWLVWWCFCGRSVVLAEIFLCAAELKWRWCFWRCGFMLVVEFLCSVLGGTLVMFFCGGASAKTVIISFTVSFIRGNAHHII